MRLKESTISKAIFYRQVWDFVEKIPVWGRAIRYQTKPDERLDMALILRWVYGARPDEFLKVAAAGLDSVGQALPERLLVLPTNFQLLAIKISSRFGGAI